MNSITQKIKELGEKAKALFGKMKDVKVFDKIKDIKVFDKVKNIKIFDKIKENKILEKIKSNNVTAKVISALSGFGLFLLLAFDALPGNKKKKRINRKKISTCVYFTAFLIYMEVMFHILMVHNISFSLIYPILFCGSLGLFMGILCRIFPEKVNKILMMVLTVIFCILFSSEVIFKNVFATYYALFGVLGVAGQAFDFMSTIISTILKSIIPVIFLFVIPTVNVILFAPRYVRLKKRKLPYNVISIVGAIVIHIFMLLVLLIGGRGIHSGYQLYFKNFNVDASIEKLGVTCTTHLSGKVKFFGTKTSASDLVVEEETKALPTDTSPNTLDIDFDKIIKESENNQEVIDLVDYIKAKSGTAKNQYTGMFEGYNLIWITAEGLDRCVINEEWCPNLYKMMTQGFYFKNYYTPLYFGSTSGGEWSNLTGTTPNNGAYESMERSGENQINMLFTAGKQANRLGQYAAAWHNNDYMYYSRDLSMPNMGYDWHGTGQGYEPEMSEKYNNILWPQSDRQLIEQSFEDLIKNEAETPFTCYYMTVSGHLGYSWEDNNMSVKNRDRVDNLDVSETLKAYIACQMELDDAMGDLMKKLEEAGIADRTLIVLAPDHVPYANMDLIDEVYGEEQDELDRYRNSLIIYSASMEEPIEVDKYCCSIDILPTVSNLMGWDYDSRMLDGSDILSTSEQFIMFPDLSWISGDLVYNSTQGTVKNINTGEDVEIPDEQFNSIGLKAYNWYIFSDMLFETDFFKYVEEQMPPVSESYYEKVKELRSADGTDNEDGETAGTEDTTDAELVAE